MSYNKIGFRREIYNDKLETVWKVIVMLALIVIINNFKQSQEMSKRIEELEERLDDDNDYCTECEFGNVGNGRKD